MSHWPIGHANYAASYKLSVNQWCRWWYCRITPSYPFPATPVKSHRAGRSKCCYTCMLQQQSSKAAAAEGLRERVLLQSGTFRRESLCKGSPNSQHLQQLGILSHGKPRAFAKANNVSKCTVPNKMSTKSLCKGSPHKQQHLPGSVSLVCYGKPRAILKAN